MGRVDILGEKHRSVYTKQLWTVSSKECGFGEWGHGLSVCLSLLEKEKKQIMFKSD